MKRFLITLLMIYGIRYANAQVTISFIPEISGTTLNGLFNIQLYSSLPTNRCHLTITVDGEKEGRVVKIETEEFDLTNGLNRLNGTVSKTAKIAFGNGQRAKFLQQNGYFPLGEYTYEFDLKFISNPELVPVFTFIQQIEPAAPLSLIEPYDRERVCSDRPLLTWQPSLPNINGAVYQLTLAEIRAKQSPIEALNYNLPLVNQRGIPTTILMYPSIAKPLEKGKRYAWQVTAYKGEFVLNRSEVWEFEYNCEDQLGEQPEDALLSYRNIEDLLRGNYYIGKGGVNFILVNPYQVQKLIYSITCITKPEIKIGKLPRIILENGRNKVDIPLNDGTKFKKGYSYMLHLTIPGIGVKNLRFIYE